jgi:hypothetical protein
VCESAECRVRSLGSTTTTKVVCFGDDIPVALMNGRFRKKVVSIRGNFPRQVFRRCVGEAMRAYSCTNFF